MKPEKKIDFMSILVYLAMVGLVLIIALPPVLRALLPEEVAPPSTVQDELEALICNRSMTLSNVDLSLRTTSTYKNGNLFRLILTYTKDQDQDQAANDQPSENPSETTTPEADPFDSFEEIQHFEAIPDIAIERDQNHVKIDVTEDVLSVLEEDELLAKYVQELTALQNVFEEDGYTCQVTST